jgi:NADPH-dependent 2,4-dienoyl-CoA reductase/sulfur reductase-like enzyme
MDQYVVIMDVGGNFQALGPYLDQAYADKVRENLRYNSWTVALSPPKEVEKHTNKQVSLKTILEETSVDRQPCRLTLPG